MRVLVISDVHANLAALEAVLEDAEPQGIEDVWCLGDSVGYGPEPDRCVDRIRDLHADTVVGNHDWAVIGRMDIDDFNPEARRAVVWTRSHMRASNIEWLSMLPSEPQVRGDFTLTHGSPRDPIWEYVLYPSTARANLDHFSTPFCIVGHTHVPALFIWQDVDASARAVVPPAGEQISLKNVWRMIMNPGSVGQPRDNDPRAAYAILDTDEWTWLVRRVPYPIEVTQAHMRTAGLPERLINRLSFGW